MMFEKLTELGTEEEFKSAVKANLGIDWTEEDPVPTLSQEKKKLRKDFQQNIKKETETKLAQRRVGDIRDEGKAKSQYYPDVDM